MVTLKAFRRYPMEEMQRRAGEFYRDVNRRRTVRDFTDTPLPRELIENCLKAADTAPSGANQHPWHFVVVEDANLKLEIRIHAEEEEREFYENRAPQEWLDALAPLGTDAEKPFLETAPCLIVIFARVYGVLPEGQKIKHYYVNESVGIATGILITALHHSGLVSLTHTPSPMKFLNGCLKRPENERPFLILVTGFPGGDAKVPDLKRRDLSEIATFL
ncbi:MAG: nitroreductase family protein [SAR324 cluster bacterium]|nr:nitroreductase family protein [SAR324 cluster bacterium]